jgi:hypothetical protein
MFLPRSPALHASAAELDQAEAGLDMPELVKMGVKTSVLEKYLFNAGKVERAEHTPTLEIAVAEQDSAALAD